MAKQRRIKPNADAEREQHTEYPEIYRKTRLRRKDFSYKGSVHISGNVVIEGRLIIGGNLIVEGDLSANEIFCAGRISAKGNIKGGYCVIGGSIHALGHIDLGHLETGRDAESIADELETDDESRDEDVPYVEQIFEPLVLEDINLRDELDPDFNPAVKSGDYLDCYTMEVHGDVEVGTWLDIDDAEIHGCLNADNIYLEGELIVYGLIYSNNNINCDYLYASEVFCKGNIECGVMKVEDDISAQGHILSGEINSGGSVQSGEWIVSSGAINCDKYIKAGELVVAGGGITTGADYGILAGLCLPRSQWAEKGFVSSPLKPMNILSGEYIEGKGYEIVTEEIENRNAGRGSFQNNLC